MCEGQGPSSVIPGEKMPENKPLIFSHLCKFRMFDLAKLTPCNLVVVCEATILG